MHVRFRGTLNEVTDHRTGVENTALFFRSKLAYFLSVGKHTALHGSQSTCQLERSFCSVSSIFYE
jgi:hypothetical protein